MTVEQLTRRTATLVVGALLITGCGGTSSSSVATAAVATVVPTATAGPTAAPAADEDPSGAPAPPATAEARTDATDEAPSGDSPAPAATATAVPAAPGRPPAPNGRVAPLVALTPTGLADQIARAEAGIRDLTLTEQERADLGHLHQVAIRRLGYAPEWDVEVFEALPPEWRESTRLHLSARRELINLHSGYDAADFIPAWQIIEPESVDSLRSHYEDAEAATGVEWEYLAAINLIETGMGRIRGLSSAGAQGPMQFLPTTWAEAGIGEGDINDPRDAIAAAARYLVRRGGPDDMAGALWGYNNSDQYVSAVLAYADLLRRDPSALEVIHRWEIYFFTEAGDIWLPTGFSTAERVDLDDHLAVNPWSAPDPGLR